MLIVTMFKLRLIIYNDLLGLNFFRFGIRDDKGMIRNIFTEFGTPEMIINDRISRQKQSNWLGYKCLSISITFIGFYISLLCFIIIRFVFIYRFFSSLNFRFFFF